MIHIFNKNLTQMRPIKFLPVYLYRFHLLNLDLPIDNRHYSDDKLISELENRPIKELRKSSSTSQEYAIQKIIQNFQDLGKRSLTTEKFYNKKRVKPVHMTKDTGSKESIYKIKNEEKLLIHMSKYEIYKEDMKINTTLNYDIGTTDSRDIQINKSVYGDRMNSKDINQIESCLLQKDFLGAYYIYEQNFTLNIIPPYDILRKLASSASQIGYVLKVEILRSVAKLYYSDKIEKDLFFDYYLCEALFTSGKESESLELLETSVNIYPTSKRLKEITAYIIRKVDFENILSHNLIKLFNIVCAFIEKGHISITKPAFELWIVLQMSNSIENRKMADSLLVLKPGLLSNNSEKLKKRMIDVAFENNNIILLQNFTEIFIKLQDKKLLEDNLGALLILFCLSDNVRAASEVMKFVHQEGLSLLPNNVRYFTDLLNRKKLPIPPSLVYIKE